MILSAGSLGSLHVHILMLSGIEPILHLKEASIEAKVGLLVGKNLCDHVVVYLGFTESSYNLSTLDTANT